MREKTKLPLLKEAIKCILKNLRSIDSISLITYNTKAEVLIQNMCASNYDSVSTIIDSLVATGQTSSTKGMELAYTNADKNFIANGNNQIIIATDGAFKLAKEDDLFLKNIVNRNIKMAVLGFGNEKSDLWNLYKLSIKAKGTFMQIKPTLSLCSFLFDELKTNSLKKL